MTLRRRKKAAAPKKKEEEGYNVDLDEEIPDNLLDPDDDEREGPQCTDPAVFGLPPGKCYITVGKFAIVHIDRRNLQLFYHSKKKKITKWRPIGFYGELDKALNKILKTEFKAAITTQHRAKIADFLCYIEELGDLLTKQFHHISCENFDETVKRLEETPALTEKEPCPHCPEVEFQATCRRKLAKQEA